MQSGGAAGHDGFGLPGIVALNCRNGGLEKGRSRRVLEF